jgi:dTDP-4-amino-4,6-dideoxygalactose transaminase
MKKIPLAVPNLEGDEALFLQECITSTFVSSVGPFVDRFEAEIAQLSGVAHAAVVCSGTVALQMAFEAAGIGEGDLVMVPSLTFIASPNAISHSRAAPWLVDVSEQDWSLDIDLCRQLIETETEPARRGRKHKASGKTLAALCPVMIMGASLDLEAYLRLAREFDLKVIVDAAAAVGGEAPGGARLAETGVDAVCYSFNGNKTVTCGGGGAIASADAELIARVKHLVTTGRVGGNYDHDVIGYNFRMTNVQAALGVAQLKRLDSFLEAKRQHATSYLKFAGGFQALQPFPAGQGGRDTHWFSGLFYTGSDSDLPDAFRAHMNAAGVDLRPFWKPIHLQTPYLSSLASDVPVSDGIWQRIFPLPCSTHLRQDEMDRVLAAADSFWSNH